MKRCKFWVIFIILQAFLNSFVLQERRIMKRKTQRIITIIVLAVAAFCFTGCYPDRDDELSLLGAWIEESPVEERTEIFFHSPNNLTITREEGVSDNYEFSIVENSIILTPEGEDETGLSELFFRQLDDNSFQIENLYPSIPEDDPTYMIFRRKTSGD